MNQIIKVKIINFDQYIKRKDLKIYTWISLNIDLFNDPDFFGINGDELKVFLYIIFLATKAKSDVVEVNVEHLLHTCVTINECLQTTLRKLNNKKFQVIENTDETQIRTDPYGLRTNPCSTYITDITNITNKTQKNVDDNLNKQILRSRGDIVGNRLRYPDWVAYLKEKKLDESRIISQLDRVVEVFETIDKLKEFLKGKTEGLTFATEYQKLNTAKKAIRYEAQLD